MERKKKWQANTKDAVEKKKNGERRFLCDGKVLSDVNFGVRNAIKIIFFPSFLFFSVELEHSSNIPVSHR